MYLTLVASVNAKTIATSYLRHEDYEIASPAMTALSDFRWHNPENHYGFPTFGTEDSRMRSAEATHLISAVWMRLLASKEIRGS